MSTPNDPQDPYRPPGEPTGEPAEPGQPQYPGTPQYPGAPQDQGALQQPAVPQYGQYAPPPEGQPVYPGYPAATPYPAAPQYGAQGYALGYPKNGLAVWSLVLSIAGLVLCGFFTGIPAVIVGSRAKRAVAEGQANNGGMATAGIVIGWVVIALSILGIIVSIVAIGNAGGWSEYVDDLRRTSGS